MMIDEQITHLERRIKRDKSDIASTVVRVSPENNLIYGLFGNLANLHSDISRLKFLIEHRSVLKRDKGE